MVSFPPFQTATKYSSVKYFPLRHLTGMGRGHFKIANIPPLTGRGFFSRLLVSRARSLSPTLSPVSAGKSESLIERISRGFGGGAVI